jgi:3-hydroxyacyl-CoA dehydrogenase/enoyl-CoA hydratase/3-hydroxybutyryl-CoA epimerase
MLDNAIAFANEIISGKTDYYENRRKPRGPANLVLEKTALGRKIIFAQTEKMVLKKSGGHYPAPLRALKVIKETYNLPLEKGFDIEARALGDLVVSPISKNLVQIFFWTEEIKKENGTKKKTVKPFPVSKAGVLGAGVMGGGIAQLFAAKQIETRVKDVNHLAVTKAYQQAAGVLKEKVQRRRMTTEEYRQIMLRISGTTDYSGFKSMDLVVEAIVEDLKIKKVVLAELEEYISDSCIVASNTSSLLIDDMAAAMKHKKRFVGMHFFNPVHRMPLVEVIRGKATSDEAVATIFDLCKKTGKTPIVVNDGPGFLVNRLLLPYMVESVSLLEEGHSVQTLDKAMKKFGMPMGPIELFDEVGIDVAYKVAKILRETMSDRMAESDLLDKLVMENRLGKKNGIGFYKYDGRKKVYDSAVEEFISVKGKSDLTAEQLNQRMVYPMINEAARCLEDKISSSARDVDIGMIFGTGFAPFRGGLLKYADTEGLGKIIDTLGGFEKQFGGRFKPADYLVKIKDGQGTFYR